MRCRACAHEVLPNAVGTARPGVARMRWAPSAGARANAEDFLPSGAAEGRFEGRAGSLGAAALGKESIELNRLAGGCYGNCTDRAGCPERVQGVGNPCSLSFAGLDALGRPPCRGAIRQIRAAVVGRLGRGTRKGLPASRRSQLVRGLRWSEDLTMCPAVAAGSRRAGWSRPAASCRHGSGDRRLASVR